MPIIKLETLIDSTPEICFDLCASIDMHKVSTGKTQERAIAGRTSGIIQLNETVTWSAVHFGIRQELTSLISAFDRPVHFRDEQLKGAFKYFHHDHYFEEKDGKVLMTDTFEFESPGGPIGRLFNKLVLTDYMRRFLVERNQMIKTYAESDQWKEILGTPENE